MKILYLSTHHEPCGVADYAHRFQAALAERDHQVDFFDSFTALKKLSPPEFASAIERLAGILPGYDLAHLQHEFAFFSDWQAAALAHCLERFMAERGAAVATFHTSSRPPWSWRLARMFFPKNWRAVTSWSEESKLVSFAGLNLQIVHTEDGRRALRRFPAFRRADIRVLPLPIDLSVTNPGVTPTAERVRNELGYRTGDVLVALPGFLVRPKGAAKMISALPRLPPRFKLIIAGGLHPLGGEAGFLDEILKQVDALQLRGRVCVTGYLAEADLHSVIALSDLAVFPYDRSYASASGIVGTALAHGKCAVASPTAAFLELSRRTQGLVLARSDRPSDLAAAVLQTASRPPFDSGEIIQAAKNLSYRAIAGILDRDVYQVLGSRRTPR